MGSCLMHKWEDDDERIISQPKEKEVEGTMWVGEMILPDGCEFRDENGNAIHAQKIVMVKKQPQYPKTYEECVELLDLSDNPIDMYYVTTEEVHLFEVLIKLKRCRDAYWKLAGNWKPDWKDDNIKKFIICSEKEELNKYTSVVNHALLAFPTAEMRDAFYENFKSLIKEVKEFL